MYNNNKIRVYKEYNTLCSFLHSSYQEEEIRLQRIDILKKLAVVKVKGLDHIATNFILVMSYVPSFTLLYITK